VEHQRGIFRRGEARKRGPRGRYAVGKRKREAARALIGCGYQAHDWRQYRKFGWFGKGGSAPATTLGAIFCTAAVRTFLAYACLQMFNLETPDRLGFLEAETIVTA